MPESVVAASAGTGAGRRSGAVPGEAPDEVAWTVYVLVSRGGRRTYVGVSRDPERRLAQHNGALAGGARTTRSGRPWRVGALFGPFPSRGEAQRAEARLRRLRGRARLAPSAELGLAPLPTAPADPGPGPSEEPSAGR